MAYLLGSLHCSHNGLFKRQASINGGKIFQNVIFFLMKVETKLNKIFTLLPIVVFLRHLIYIEIMQNLFYIHGF